MNRNELIGIVEKAFARCSEVEIALKSGTVVRGWVTDWWSSSMRLHVNIFDMKEKRVNETRLDTETLKSIVVFPDDTESVRKDPTSTPVAAILWLMGQGLWDDATADLFRYQDSQFAEQLIQWFALRTPEERSFTFDSSHEDWHMFFLFLAMWAGDVGL